MINSKYIFWDSWAKLVQRRCRLFDANLKTKIEYKINPKTFGFFVSRGYLCVAAAAALSLPGYAPFVDATATPEDDMGDLLAGLHQNIHDVHSSVHDALHDRRAPTDD